MRETLRGFFPQWRMLTSGAFTAGLNTKAPLDHSTAMKGLSYIGKCFPELTESRFDTGEEIRLVLRTPDVSADKEVLFRLVDYKRFEFAWGPLAEIDFPSKMETLFNAIQDGFEVFPINVELIDLKFVVTSQWEGHHYRAILDAFLSNTPLGRLFDPERVLQDDLFLRGSLDENRICIVGIDSDVGDNEVVRGEFKDDLLRAYAGVAQTKRIPFDVRIADIFLQHSTLAVKFFLERFIPNVVVPLDRALTDLSQRKE